MLLIRGKVTEDRLICGITIGKTRKAKANGYKALIDTGATRSCITEQVVQDLQLESIGKEGMANTTGVYEASLYEVCLVLYWNIRYPSSPDPQPQENLTQENLKVVGIATNPLFQAIIGMDIIGKGLLLVSGGRFDLGWGLPNN